MKYQSYSKVINMRNFGNKCPDGAFRIDRATKWGNPFKIDKNMSRINVVYKYRGWLLFEISFEEFESYIKPVCDAIKIGSNLACWCAPLPCHGDVLLEVAKYYMIKGERGPTF